MTVDVVTVNGSGCKQGTAEVVVSSDNTSFWVIYSDYLAQAGKGAPAADIRKNCQLNLQLDIPQGFTYGIAEATYAGYGHLQRGASGYQAVNYYFQGQSETNTWKHNFAGPFDDNWSITHRTEFADIVYAPCGEKKNLNLNSSLRVDKGTSDANTNSFLTMDYTRGEVRTLYHFSWKRC
ncbi:DUF4360 domain-containing protein [Lentzea sp.]|uniref:DUF4360 domain-containing protein n=1 Tax=Lentzea sp. TaxID=56099 RepID=UPI002C0FC5A9|nr:DUF4360 domain-containing protein [Lentzea sp.]HUQ59787.1 DUF4360 domain-containing protein [Lentzea sp.]